MNNYSNPMVTYNEIVEALRAILDCAKVSGYLDDYSFLNARYDMINKSPLQEEQEQALIQAIQSLEKTIDAADKIIRESLQQVLDELVASDLFVIPTRYKINEELRKLAAQDEFVAKLQEMSLPTDILTTLPEETIESIDDVEELENPFEEIVPESLEIPTIAEENPTENIYYSRVKLTDMRNAFAVTDMQYQKLQQAGKKDAMSEEKQDDLSLTIDDFSALTHVSNKDEKKEELPSIIDTPLENSIPTIENEKQEKEMDEKSDKKKNSMNRIQLIKKALDKAKEKENVQLIQILEQQLKKEIETLKD